MDTNTRGIELLEQKSLLGQMENAVARTIRNLQDGSPLKARNKQWLHDIQEEALAVDRQYDALKADAFGLDAAAKRALEVAAFRLPSVDRDTLVLEVTKQAGRDKDGAAELVFFSLREAEEAAATALIRVAVLQSYLSAR